MALDSNIEFGETPRSLHKVGSAAIGSVGYVDLTQYRAKCAEDMEGRSVLADCIWEFLDELLPYPAGDGFPSRPKRENPFLKMKDADGMLEAEVVELMLEVIEEHDLCPGFALKISQHKADPSDVDQAGQKIDGAFFHSDEAPTDGRPCWFLQIIPVEFKSRKHGNCWDPYTDIGQGCSPDSDAETRRETRGQVTTYAERIFCIQHRWGLFMLLIIGRRFRILYWDRGGTIVTKSIDYYEQPDTLCDFLWRVSHLPEEKLGIDPTATRLQPDDFDFLRMDLAALSRPKEETFHHERDLSLGELEGDFSFKYVRAEFAETVDDDSYPRHLLRVDDEKGSRSFLVGKPVYTASGMAGRGTRGYIAHETATKRFFWLKDAWRASYEHISCEGDILHQLHDADITNVPTVVCHGDVNNQATVTADWWERKNPQGATDSTSAASRSTHALDSIVGRMKPKSDGKASSADCAERAESNGTGEVGQSTRLSFRMDNPIRRLVHYRMVVAEVCMRLDKFTNGRQLVSIVLDCLHSESAISTSVFTVGILHRDITGDNILIYPKVITKVDGSRRLEWKGILSDWEISKLIVTEAMLPRPRQPERTGTWQFVSVNLLSNELARLTIPDELESVFYVLVYYALRYLQSNLSDHQVAKLLDEFFDCFTYEDGVISCGNLKASTLRTHGELKVIQGRYGSVRVLFRSPIDHIITTLLQWFKARYAVLDYEVWVEENGGLLLGNLPKDMSHTAQTPPPPSRNAVSQDDYTVDDEDRDDYDDEVYQELAAKDPPTDDETALAKRIEGHDDMIAFLTPFVQPSSRWQLRDKAPSDRVPTNYVSPHPIMPNGKASKAPPAKTGGDSKRSQRRDSSVGKDYTRKKPRSSAM
ncbi:hypothetical protein LXA43DRAFT_894995 [Ganoderma leucocontextum]|nr:hypothetical protein LXA43DRAFT_894995 [Ganoderma leucocontextum]